jgi:hypothetical protein
LIWVFLRNRISLKALTKMPHVIDKETGLCVVCKRLDIAAIKEAKKYKRQNYDIRKMAIDNMIDKKDPNYRIVTDRHYVKYNDSFYNTKEREMYFNELPRHAFAATPTLVYHSSPRYEDDEDEEIKQIERKARKASKEREKLRKVFKLISNLIRRNIKVQGSF